MRQRTEVIRYIDDAMQIKSPKQPPKVPKIYMANRCIFDCKYCCHRCVNEAKHGYIHEPAELARLAVEQAKNSTHGIFISSAIHKSADYTGEMILETLRKIRFEHGYKGYVHAKVMPGTDPLLVEQTGWLADRMSINIELPHSEGYKIIAKQKTRENILGPMADIAQSILVHRDERGKDNRRYAKSGQTTQMMVGTMHETDRIILTLAQALYRKYNLRRVYYSAFGVPMTMIITQSASRGTTVQTQSKSRITLLLNLIEKSKKSKIF